MAAVGTTMCQSLAGSRLLNSGSLKWAGSIVARSGLSSGSRPAGPWQAAHTAA